MAEAITPTWTVNCSILLTNLPLLERPAAAAAAGFRGVEFWWPFATPTPAHEEVDAFVGAIEAAGVRLTGLNFDAGNMPGGDRGLVSWPSRSADLRANLDVVTTIGERTGCRAFNALYGNRQEDQTPEAQDELGAYNLALAARAVGRIGGTVLVEPVSGAPAYPLKTAADAIAVLDRVASEHGETNLGLLFDVYHLAVNGDDVDAALAAHRDRVAHVQVADAPGRGEPGTGDLPIDRWVEDLRAGGYDGWVGLEYKTAAADPFVWLPASER
ncbi:hydroxypyruvate isomerase family protein [Cellulosimicrobium arenosum]|uniref:TIM barrel protein n=1 Tax=Cellulosimicrobium arenosum TaxID=2708133 RepID=A0A927PFV7_9MICO|nr:TIM barrel protein [Cellulosimicrobium arenosum]MBD8080463.1 TIM barrel protein [Cellulosimicrobium arenosum]